MNTPLGNSILTIFPLSVVSLLLCEVSLASFTTRFKLSQDDIIEFLEQLKFPFTLVLSKKPIITSRDIESGEYEKFFMDTSKRVIVGTQIFCSLFIVLLLAGLLYSVFNLNSLSDKIISLVIFIIYSVLFYKSWRFGHSLKSKAQE